MMWERIIQLVEYFFPLFMTERFVQFLYLFFAEEGSANDDASGGASTVTMRARGGNTFVIQSMPSLPDGVLPDGIRINSVEATILAPNEDLASALTGDGEYLIFGVNL